MSMCCLLMKSQECGGISADGGILTISTDGGILTIFTDDRISASGQISTDPEMVEFLQTTKDGISAKGGICSFTDLFNDISFLLPCVV